MKEILPFVQIIISVLLVTVILLQQGGAAMGSAFGEGEGFHTEKRGAEKYLFHATIALGALFVGIALLTLFI